MIALPPRITSYNVCYTKLLRERRVLDEGGLVDETNKALVEAQLLLGEARSRLKQVDVILDDIQAVSADARVISGEARAASTDLAALRAEVDESVRNNFV